MSNQKFEHQENRGSLFSNKDKKTDKHPDYKGSINVDGKVYWMTCWNSTSKAGMDYMTVSVTEMDDNYSNKSNILQNQKSSTSIQIDDSDEELPF